MGAFLVVAGFGAGLVLYALLPEMDVFGKRWYSLNVAPLVEECVKFLPFFFGADPVPFAFGFSLFEVFLRRGEKPGFLAVLVLFHVSATGVAWRYFPLGFPAAVVSHYFLNRRADERDAWYLVLVLLLLWANGFRIFSFPCR